MSNTFEIGKPFLEFRQNLQKSILALLLLLFLQACQSTTSKPLQTDFKLSEYEVSYKNKPLPFGKTIADWEKVFGKSRKDELGNYFWDNIGVKLSIGEDGKIAPPADGELSDIHKINFRTDILYIYMIENLEPWNTLVAHPKKPYLQTINFQGSALKSGMSLNEINDNRDDKDLSPFGYLDQGMDPFSAKQDGSINTEKNNGPYIQTEPQEVENKTPIYSLYLYFKLNKFEHIEIEANFENGKIKERVYTKMR